MRGLAWAALGPGKAGPDRKPQTLTLPAPSGLNPIFQTTTHQVPHVVRVKQEALGGPLVLRDRTQDGPEN